MSDNYRKAKSFEVFFWQFMLALSYLFFGVVGVCTFGFYYPRTPFSPVRCAGRMMKAKLKKMKKLEKKSEDIA